MVDLLSAIFLVFIQFPLCRECCTAVRALILTRLRIALRHILHFLSVAISTVNTYQRQGNYRASQVHLLTFIESWMLSEHG
jgi:hypothetical protein